MHLLENLLVAIRSVHNLLSVNLVNFPIFWGEAWGQVHGLHELHEEVDLYNYSYRMLVKNTGKDLF